MPRYRRSPPRPEAAARVRQPLPVATALRESFRQGYDRKALRADLLSGAVVGVVALPLSMALAIATGVSPEHGLYTAVVAGGLVPLLGGSRFQVTGPTAAFIVILAPIVGRFGLEGLLIAGLLAGAMLVGMGLARLGRFIQFIPHPVTTGFTAGIATVIATLQLKDAFGLTVGAMPDGFPEKVEALWHARATASLPDAAVAAATLALLLLIPRVQKRIPAPLIALTLAAVLAAAARRYWPEVAVATIGSRFHFTVDGVAVSGIPPVPPHFAWPWGAHLPTLAHVRELLPAAFAIAMLGAIESLLSAVVADGMGGTRHDSNAELFALGIGNLVAPFFGGIAATGALARTATNVRAGARSPLAAVFHAAVVLASILLFAPLIAWVPMASLAALLLVVAWNMSELRHFAHTVRVAPRSDVILLITCFVLTVVFDMVIAVSFGVVLAALLFMRRMAETTTSRIFSESAHPGAPRAVPEHVALYQIAGPLFFGAAQSAMSAISTVSEGVRVVVLDLGAVPVIDASGLVALESALERLQLDRKFAIVAGPLPEPRSVFERANLERHHDNIVIAADLDEALRTAEDLVLLNPGWATGAPSSRREA